MRTLTKSGQACPLDFGAKTRNYLLPVDARIDDELDVPYQGVAVEGVLEHLGERDRDAVNLVILDACRDNPYGGGGRSPLGARAWRG